MCPDTTKYVSLYYYMCPYTTIYVSWYCATQVLTANLVWWRKHGARVAELEKQLGCKIGSKIGSNAEHQAASSTPAASAVSGMPSFQLPLFSSDKSASNREALVSEVCVCVFVCVCVYANEAGSERER